MKALQQEINLYQSSFRKVKVRFSALQVTRAALVMVVSLVVFSVYNARSSQGIESQVATLDSQAQELETRIESIRASLAGDQGQSSEQLLAELKQRRGNKLRTLEDLETQYEFQSRLFSSYFEGLARRTLDGLWLEDVRVSEGGAAIQLTGSTLDAEHIPRWIKALKEEPAFAGVTFRSASLDRNGSSVTADSLRFSLRTHLPRTTEETQP